MNTFGRDLSDVTPTQSGYFGQDGWYQIPPGYFCRFNATDSRWEVSPNKDFSTPVYNGKINEAGYLVFFNTYWNRMTGTA